MNWMKHFYNNNFSHPLTLLQCRRNALRLATDISPCNYKKGDRSRI